MPQPVAVLDGLRRVLESLAEAVATPTAPAGYLDLFAPMRPGTHRARVIAVRPETSDAATVVLRPAGRWPGHRAGQSVRLGIEVDGVRLWRSYSLTAPPAPDGTLRVTVRAVDGGRVSTHLVHRMHVGTIIGLEGPDGDFTLPDPLPPKALFVSAGSGITPVMGMLRTWLPDLPDVVVVHAARTPDDVLFGAELRRWDREGRIRLVERHTAADGRLDAAELAELVPDVAERRTWVCGPNGLVDAVTAWFGGHGWSEHLHAERFRPVVSVVGEGGTVSFARSDRAVTADGATTLLDAGEQVGVLLPSGCRRGICYGCVVPLRQGAVRDVRTGTVTRAEPGDGVFVQACVSAAAGPCTLDA